MPKAEKKILGILPKSGVVGVVLGGLIVAFVLALIWSWVMSQSFSYNNAWVQIIELIALALLVGVAVGILAKEVKASTLWIAAGLGVVAVAWAGALASGQMGSLDSAILGSMGGTGIDVTGPAVSIGTLVLAAVAAASVSLGRKIKL
jgi:hypothetical protein